MKQQIKDFFIRHDSWLESFILPAFLFLSIFYLEAVLRAATSSGFRADGLLYSYLFSGLYAMVISVILGVLRGKVRYWTTLFLFLLITLLYASQFIYFTIFQTYYSAFSAAKAAQVLEFTGVILDAIQGGFFWLILVFAPFTLLVMLYPRPGDLSISTRSGWNATAVTLILALILYGAALLGINTGERSVNSAWDVYYRNSYPIASVDRLGLLTSMRLDLIRTLTHFEPPAPALPEEPVQPEADPTPDPTPAETTLTEGASGTGTGSSQPEMTQELPVEYGYNVLDIDFDRIIADTEDSSLKSMHQYFSQRPPSRKNEYTGKFKGYNLILITAEAFSHYAVDPNLTPTLYRMVQEGFHFTNFYNPIWGVSTSDGEYVATTGLIPKTGVWSMYKSAGIEMPFAMGNQLKRLGYQTRAYHNHTFDYYRRDLSHPNLGYDYKGLGNGLDVRPTWPESDLEMMELTADEYIGQEPFHTYYMTVSGHMDYVYDGNFIASKNQALVENLPYLEGGKAYLAANIELDRAMEYLLQELEKAGVAERTLIAISADHYPYGLNREEIDDLAGHEVEENFELYRSSFILYARGMEPETIDRPISSMDIIPTISNLMGLEYDSRLLMGNDIFSDQPPLVIFNNRSFISEIGRYDSRNKEFILQEGVTKTKEEIDSYRKKMLYDIENRFYYSAKILDTDYYSLVVDR